MIASSVAALAGFHPCRAARARADPAAAAVRQPRSSSCRARSGLSSASRCSARSPTCRSTCRSSKAWRPTDAGLQLTPMMAGMLVTSIASGQIISRIGRYQAPFRSPARRSMTAGLAAALDIRHRRRAPGRRPATCWCSALGLGMVMQVLVLAVQNAVDYADLGVATSGTTLFRSIGGSVGVSAFGAIFTAGLAAHLAGACRAGEICRLRPNPPRSRPCRTALRAIYADAFTAALHPVFLTAACIGAAGFAAGVVSPRTCRCAARRAPTRSARASRCRATRPRWRNSSRSSAGCNGARTAGGSTRRLPRRSGSRSRRTRSGCWPASAAPGGRSARNRRSAANGLPSLAAIW